MAATELKPVYLLTGSDRPKIARALQRLRARVGEDAIEHLDAPPASGDDAVAACNALGFFSAEARLVVVSLVDKWKVADVKAVAAYLESPAPGTVLALVAEELKADSPLAKAVAKAGQVLAFSVQKGRLQAWVAEQFKAAGARADADACAALVQLAGEDLHQLASEVDKLATWAAGEPIGEREVEALVPPLAETSDYKLAELWAKRDVRGLLRLSEETLGRDSKPRRDVSARLAARFGAQVGTVVRAKRLKDAGVSVGAAQKELGVRFDWQARRAYEQAEPFSQAELDSALVRLAELDHALKGGSRLAPDLELQRALVDVSRNDERSRGAAR